MGERLTWDEIVKKYPHQWVVLDQVIYKEKEEVNIKSAVVVRAVTDKEVRSLEIKYIRNGKNYEVVRTADEMNVGVITCENYRVEVLRKSN